MDPNAALAEIREIIARRDRDREYDVERLYDLVEGLDNWLSNGGFRPRAWQRGQE